MSATATVPAVREITDEEVRFYQENGWVKLDQLISSEAAVTLLDRVKALMGADASGALHPRDGDNPQAIFTYFHTWEPLSSDIATGAPLDDLFYAVSHSPAVGRLGEKLNSAPVRFWIDGALVKMPSKASETGSGPTNWHADVGAVDRSPFSPPEGQMQLWVALRDMTPEHGTMRFVAPAMQTSEVREICERLAADPEASYPRLEEMGVISAPISMRAGDATIHSSATLHSAPPNRSDSPRWGYFISLFPADSVWSGSKHFALDKVQGLQVGEAFDNARFPVLA
jgi:hypothetical protein